MPVIKHQFVIVFARTTQLAYMLVFSNYCTASTYLKREIESNRSDLERKGYEIKKLDLIQS